MSYFIHILIWLFDINTILVCFVFLALYYGLKQTKNLPPGPRGWPLVGNIPGLIFDLYRTGDEPEHMFAKLARKYGDVFCLKAGTNIIVVANGCKSIKDAYQNPHISDRPKSSIFEEAALDEGVAFTSGKSWKYQRKFTLGAFRNFGVGRSAFEDNISEEIQIFLREISDPDERAFNPHYLLSNSLANVICGVVFGKRYHHSDPEFTQITDMLAKLVKIAGSGGLIFFIPFLRHIFAKSCNAVVFDLKRLPSLIEKIEQEHKKVFDKSNMHDILDVFLNEIDVASEENSDRKDYIHERAMRATAAILFMAGVETSSTTLRWALLYMIMHPEVQVKVQHEIDSVVGRDRLPKWSDRLQLPYTEAVLLEIQRIRTITPLGLPHVASEDTNLAGYDVPKGSLVVSNVWALHNDPDIWERPHEFRPERFLDPNGSVCQREEFIPFGTGHRVCLGENLARMEIFLFFTHTLHTFFLRNPTMKPVSMKGVGGVAFGPVDYKIVAERRK